MKINRRNALKNILTLSTATCFSPQLLAQTPIEVSIENAKVFTNGKLENIFLGINTEGKILLDRRKMRAKRYIDATGLIASSGFINILSGNIDDPEIPQNLDYQLLQEGVTTSLQLKHTHKNPNFQKKYFSQKTHQIHYGAGISISDFYSMVKNQRQTSYFLEQNLDHSSMFAYLLWQPELLAFKEVLHYAKIVAKKGCPLFIRFPQEGDFEKNIDIAISLAQKSEAKIHIEHLHRMAKGDKMKIAIDKIQQANWIGLSITASVYPQTYWKNYLAKMREITQQDSLKKLEIDTVRTVEKEDSTYSELPKIIEESSIIAFQENVRTALKSDFCFIIPESFQEKSASNFPLITALQYGLNTGFSLEKILSKITLAPASLFSSSLGQRATIKESNWADLVLFNPREIQNQDLKKAKTSAIKYVFLEGKLVLENQDWKAAYGKYMTNNINQ